VLPWADDTTSTPRGANVGRCDDEIDGAKRLENKRIAGIDNHRVE